MTFEEVERMGQAPIMVRGMKVGLIIRWSKADQEVGVQVPGEEDIRWVAVADIVDLAAGGGALATIDALVDDA